MVYGNIFWSPGVQSILPNRPDVLRCSEDNHMFYLSDNLRYQYMDNRFNEFLTFHPDGTFSHLIGDRSRSYLCAGKTLAQLEDMGLAYNLVTSKNKDPESDDQSTATTRSTATTTSIKPGVPDAIACDYSKMFYRLNTDENIFWTLDNTFHFQMLVYDMKTGENTIGLNRGNQVATCEFKSLDALYQEGKAFNFVSAHQADTTGLTSVHAGWPDVISCDDSLYFLSHDDSDNNERIYVQPLSQHNRLAMNGVHFSLRTKSILDAPSPSTCIGATIDELYTSGQAYNWISGNGVTRYFFEYTLEDHVFEDFNITQVPTDTVRSQGGGKLTNCAKGMASMERSVHLSISNEQSLSVSKSFTSAATASVAAGYSVSTSVSAHALFVSVSAATSAGLQVTETFTASATRTDSMTLTTTSTISFELATAVEVEPETCSEYSLATQVSAQPVHIPFTAMARLAVYNFDMLTGRRGEQVTDVGTLSDILELLNDENVENYQAAIDSSDSTITFEIEGIYTGTFATNSETKVRECELHCSSEDPDTTNYDVSFVEATRSAAAGQPWSVSWVFVLVLPLWWVGRSSQLGYIYPSFH